MREKSLRSVHQARLYFLALGDRNDCSVWPLHWRLRDGTGASVTDGKYKDFVTNNRSGGIVDVGAARTVGLVLRYDM